jgi:hypothetical protein
MDEEPDIEITAAVRAAEVRFECKPQVDVVAYADSPAIVESVSERENLPDEVAPGGEYREVAVRWRVAARLHDPDWGDALSEQLRARRVSRDTPADREQPPRVLQLGRERVGERGDQAPQAQRARE